MTRLTTAHAALVIAVSLAMLGCPPKVRNFNPTAGEEGDDVTVRGERFGSTAAGNEVRIGNTAATDVRLPQKDTLVVKVPPGAQTGLVSVTVKGRTGTSSENFRVERPAKWTFMVYVDGDNDLEGAAIDDFLEMATVGSSPAVNVVVQMDRRPGWDPSYADWRDTRRFLVRKGDTPSSAPVQNLGEVNMGDPRSLQEFVEWAVTTYPAERYLLSIWNHGGGWRLQQQRLELMAAEHATLPARRATDRRAAAPTPPPAATKAVAWDDTDGDVLFMREVQLALEAAKASVEARSSTAVKLDVVGYDACLMGMVEVAYAMRNVANVVVGSEEVEPADGWPYDAILADLTAHPGYDARDLAGVIVTKYADSYDPAASVTQAALDVAALANVASKIDAFTAKATTDWPAVRSARTASRSYFRPWSVDLGDFAARVYSQATAPDLRTAATELRSALTALVVNERHGTPMSGSTGLAIYFPETRSAYDADPDRAAYTDANQDQPVDFVRFHRWDNWLLDAYFVNNP